MMTCGSSLQTIRSRVRSNTAVAISAGAAQWVQKSRMEWTIEDKKNTNLDNMSKDILYKTLRKIQTCTKAKEIWERLTQICKENEQTKENK
ncbi:hypothetical protein F511_27806 [Dorcoceras hygrometricum]|uniref:Uncharacterized protein n=1 Tax=Dorcoceras hygrometricum TaxID=472368 RepID=A0A2Z7CPU5_9LAMI|nr:hypothetical protein F511_27806 [Dorcoceras hygrometricum]